MEEQQIESTQGRTGKVTAWIGGITALVVALGGLATAVREFTKDDAAAQTTNADAKSRPTSFTVGDGGTFRKIDGLWVWTNTDGVWRYTELENDGNFTVGVCRDCGTEKQDIYVKWPNAGGQALQSYDDQVNWTDGVYFTAAKS